MLKFSVKQNRIRTHLNKNEIKKTVLKTIKVLLIKISNKILKKYLHQITNKNTKSTSFTRIKTICILTGRSRSVYRFFRLSRMKIREYANAGYFTGVTKAS